jgi:hypothetical protein
MTIENKTDSEISSFDIYSTELRSIRPCYPTLSFSFQKSFNQLIPPRSAQLLVFQIPSSQIENLCLYISGGNMKKDIDYSNNAVRQDIILSERKPRQLHYNFSQIQ